MAEAVGMGFDINALLKNIQKADKSITDLMDKSNQASRSIITAFQQMSSQGVVPYTQSLEKQLTLYQSIKNEITNVDGSAKRGFGGMKKEIDNVINSLNVVISNLQKTDQWAKGLGQIMGIAREVREMETRVDIRTDGQTWDVNAKDVIKKHQDELAARREYLEQMEQMYARLWDSVLAKESKSDEERYALWLMRKHAEEKEHKRIEDEKVKATQDAIAKQNAEYERQNELRAAQAATNTQVKTNSEQIKHDRDAEYKMYADMFDKIAKKNGQTAEQIIKENQDELRQRRAYIDEMTKMYTQMFEEIARRESTSRASLYGYRQSSGDTSKQSTAAYNRLYSDKGVMSVNNMNKVLRQLQDAQNKLNMRTEDGKKKYAELDQLIKQVQKDINATTKAQDRMTQSTERTRRSVDNVKNSHHKLMDTAGQLQRKIALLFSVSQISQYIERLRDVRGEFEMQQRSLQSIIQDTDKANEIWDKTVALAVKSPFKVKELVTYTKQLAAYRVESDKLYDTTKMLADVSAGLGVDMNRLILAYGQVKAANYLRGTELRQFSEAGVNMLGELSKYFTEIETRAVSVNEVFERISKRGVSFEDVDVVFKRITGEGGIFYEMQENQSKTLQGMVRNLHDSIDLMLNDIGKANDGLLKGMVELSREMVENWRAFATVLTQVGAAIATMQIAKFATGWKLAAAGHAMLAVQMNGTIGAAARLRLAFATLGKTIKAHPILLIVGALASAGHALWEYTEAIDAANERYDEASRKEVRRRDSLLKLKEEVDKNNQAIKKNSENSQENNEALSKNQQILAKIKREYPELYNSVVKQKDGTIDLTRAIEEQNTILRANIALQQQAKGSFWQESQEENYKDAIDAQSNLEAKMYSLQAAAISAGANLEYAMQQGSISQETYDRFYAFLQMVENAKDIKEVMQEAGKTGIASYTMGQQGGDEKHKSSYGLSQLVGNKADLSVIRGLYGEIFNAARQAYSASDNYQKHLTNLMDNFQNQMSIFKVELKKIEDVNKRGVWLQGQLDKLGILDNKIREWARQQLEKEVNVKIVFPEPHEDNPTLKEWQNTYNKLFGDKADTQAFDPSFGFKKIQNEAVKQSEVVERLQGEYKEVYDIITAINKAGGEKATQKGGAYEGYDLKELYNQLSDVMKQLDFFGAEYTKNKKGENEALKRLRNQIKLIREAAKAYEDMYKQHGKVYSDEKIREGYEATFKEAGLGDISQYGFGVGRFGKKAEIANLNTLRDSAEKINGGMIELERNISQVSVNVDDLDKSLSDKELLDTLENLFGNYEISLELEKLNIPPDLAKQLFNVDSMDLSSLRERIKALKPQFIGTDMEEEYKKAFDKIKEMEDKAQVERMKKYVTYLVKAQSERVKIKIEELRQIAEIEKLDIDNNLKEQMKQGVRNETQQALDKDVWESFKDTDLYVQMFEDLSVVSNKVLSDLKQRLTDMRGSLSELSPTELKEIVTQLEKVTDEQISRNPFENFGKNIKDGIAALKRLKKEQEEYNNALKNQEKTQSDVDNIQVSIKAAEAEKKKAEAIIESSEASEEQVRFANDYISYLDEQIANDNKSLTIAIQKLATEKGITEEKARQLILTKQNVNSANKTLNSVGSNISQAVASMQEFTGMLNNWGISFGEEFEGALNGIGQMAGALESIDLTKPMSIITSSISFAAGLGNTIGSLFGFGNDDKKYEKQIKKQQKLVENLGRQYEDLEKKIENAYNIGTYQQAVGESKENLEGQIAAYDRMIEAEEAKKKTDKDRIQEWRDAQKDLLNQIEELEAEAFSEASGGIIDDAKSAAREFVDAWYEAFIETGDGLDGLTEHFKANLLEMVKQQAALQIAGVFTDKWQKELQKYINAEDMTLTTDEAERWYNSINKDLPELSDALTEFFNAMGSATEGAVSGAGELSGLTESIQGMSESTAEELAAYLNSIRFLVSQINDKMGESTSSTLAFATRTETDANSNPMLSELRTQTALISSINEMFGSVIGRGQSKSHTGAYLKVSI